jgi:prepilin-type N-terminal cleavage/methylation domain-containing protein
MKGNRIIRIVIGQRGMTLIEVVTCVALFSFIMTMAVPLMFDFRKATDRITRSLEHVGELDWLNRAFRADAARARQIVLEYRDFELGPNVLILRSIPLGREDMPGTEEEEHIVYSVDPKHSSRLVRTSWRANGARKTSRVIAKNLEAAEFSYGPEGESEKTLVELQMSFKKGIVHKSKPMFYALSASVGE